MQKATRRVWSILLVCFILLTMLPAGAWAADDVKEVADSGALIDAFAKGGEIQLTKDIDMSLGKNDTDAFILEVKSGNGVVLDLNGHTLSYSTTKFQNDTGVFFNVYEESSLTIKDTVGKGHVTIHETYTGAKDSTPMMKPVQVRAKGTFILESGVIENTNPDFAAANVIANYGTLLIKGGEIKGVSCVQNVAPVAGGGTMWKGLKATCTISGGKLTGVPATTAQALKEAGRDTNGAIGASYGATIMGAGAPGGDLSKVDNSLVTLNIDGGEIRAAQAVGTNASSGRYAGFTIRVTNGVLEGTNDGTGMYLPGVGETYISGGEITADQAIRICAGTLNITGGTITGTALSDNTDLVPGGSGGTPGVIVVGKASDGYVGNIEVNISENAVIQNTASGEGVKPTIVVSDKNMSGNNTQTITGMDGKPIPDATYTYDKTSISVNVEGVKIKGDVVKISSLDSKDPSNSGGNVSLNLTNAVIDGNLINNSTSTGISMEGGSVKDIKNSNKGSITVNQAKVSGEVSNTGKGDDKGQITLIGCETTATNKPGENITVISAVRENEIVSTNGKTYTGLATALQEALQEAKPGDTLYLGKGTFTATADNQFVINKNAVTLVGQGEETVIDAGKYRVDGQAGFVVQADNVTIKKVKIVADTPSGEKATSDALKFALKNDNGTCRVLEGGRVENVTLSSETGHGLNIHGVDGMVVDGVTVKKAGKLSMAISSSPDVYISNTSTVETSWGGAPFDIGIMHNGNDSNNYLKVTHVTFGEGNNFANDGTFYSEYRTDASLGSAQGQFKYENADKLVYRMGDTYVYTIQTPPAALIRDGQDPLYYKSLDAALEDVTNGDIVQLSEDYTNNGETPLVIHEGVKLIGVKNDKGEYPSITGEVEMENESSIQKVDLSAAEITVEEGALADLSNNYWGGEPQENEGATVYPYYQDEDMTVSQGEPAPEEPDDDQGGGNIVPSIDRGDGIGTRLPMADEDDTPSVTGFESDTKADLTVNGRYQFRITSLDGHTPVLTVNNSNFTVTLASRSGNDYFYVITCAGTPGSTAAVSVDGKYLLTATVGGSASGVVSDTTHPFTVAQGGTYQFRLTAAARPSFAAGSASFTVEYAGQEGNDYFYKVHAVGQAGDGCGFYINGEAQPVAVATIA